MSRTWADVWADRKIDTSKGSTLSQLMAADGLDTAFGTLPEESWLAFVRRVGSTLDVAHDASLFEIGCGAGAFLYDFYRSGCSVAGLDLSPSLVAHAQAAMPGADITHREASSFEAVANYDFVVSCGVFMYFDSLDYARRVIHQSVAGARIGVAILDIPDRATEQDAVAARRAAVGPEIYDERYSGLPHLFYERDWVEAELRSAGAHDIRIEGQSIAGYDNSAFRFNAFAWIDGAPSD